MKTIKLFTYALFVAFLSLASCSTDAEDGMDGMDGAPGIAGQDGADGQDGVDGNANIISSGWIEYETAGWGELTSTFGTDQRLYPIAVPEITEDVRDTGLIMMYTRFTVTETPAYTLPFVENITGQGTNGQEISFQVETGSLIIRMINVGGLGDPGTFGGAGVAEYRWVVLPAPAGGRQAAMSQEQLKRYYLNLGLDIYDYDAVAAYFGLE